ncbi:hypothetical protein Bbelb_415270 [Branchiostoma belcheri]|nr:hypothetical protein Bbelb_415270 [Branchiostoma belcheri]
MQRDRPQARPNHDKLDTRPPYCDFTHDKYPFLTSVWEGKTTDNGAKATVTTRRTCFCVLSTCKNAGNRTASVRVYKHNLTGGCQLVSKMHRKAQKKTTRQDPKKWSAEDTRVASDDEVNRRCTHLQRASE